MLDSVLWKFSQEVTIEAAYDNLYKIVTKVVTDMITEAEIECRLDDSVSFPQKKRPQIRIFIPFGVHVSKKF